MTNVYDAWSEGFTTTVHKWYATHTWCLVSQHGGLHMCHDHGVVLASGTNDAQERSWWPK